MMEFRLGRFASRWRLGEALSQIKRGAGPGRGKKIVGADNLFMATTERLALARETVVDAQRIACLPAEELEAFCAEKRGSPDIPTFSEGRPTGPAAILGSAADIAQCHGARAPRSRRLRASSAIMRLSDHDPDDHDPHH